MQIDWIFRPSKLLQKSTWNQRGFFDQRNYTEKVRENNEDFSTIEITSKKVRVNGVDFQTREITLKEARGNNVNFSISKITSKKYVEITWDLPKFGLRRIDIISTSH